MDCYKMNSVTLSKTNIYLREISRGVRYESDCHVMERDSESGFHWVLRDKKTNKIVDSHEKRRQLCIKNGFTI